MCLCGSLSSSIVVSERVVLKFARDRTVPIHSRNSSVESHSKNLVAFEIMFALAAGNKQLVL